MLKSSFSAFSKARLRNADSSIPKAGSIDFFIVAATLEDRSLNIIPSPDDSS
jgi:hypothetical protein